MYRLGSPVRQRASKKARSISPVTTRQSIPVTDGVGTELKNLFAKISVEICEGCGDRAWQWNRNGVQWCRDNRGELVDWLTSQAVNKKIGIVEAGAALALHEPALAARIAARKFFNPTKHVAAIAAESIVDFAIDRVLIRYPDTSTIAATLPVIISATNRSSDLHRGTIDSLRGAGFSTLYATCEPGTNLKPFEQVISVVHEERRGQWRNFIEALKIGLATQAPHFLTVEDDIEVCRGTADFIARLGWPDAKCGCVSLYSAKTLERYPVGRRFMLNDVNAMDLHGACALLFRRDAASKLVDWSQQYGWRGDADANPIENPADKKASDTFAGEILVSIHRYSIWAHNPTLVNHVGHESTLGHKVDLSRPYPNRTPLNFPGVDADLSTIFANEIT